MEERDIWGVRMMGGRGLGMLRVQHRTRKKGALSREKSGPSGIGDPT